MELEDTLETMYGYKINGSLNIFCNKVLKYFIF